MSEAIFPYSWNAPRPAIGGYQVDDGARAISYLTPQGRRNTIPLAEVYETDERPGRALEVRRRLMSLPHFVRRQFAHQLEQLERRGKSTADRWLLETFERFVLTRIDDVNCRYTFQDALPAALMPLYEPLSRLLWAGKKELKRLAYNLADLLGSEFMREFDAQHSRTGDPHFSTLYAYGRIGFIASHLNTDVPGWACWRKHELRAEQALSAAARLQSPLWWLNRLCRIHACWREHLLIAAGYVHQKRALYCSDLCLQEWRAQRKANRDFLNAMELENIETGERISLADKVVSSVANPAIRRCELMVRMRGFEDIADAEGLRGAFFTLTAPSKYHAMQRDGRRNDKYCGASPRETQQYLCRTWAKVRAAWLRADIRVFGFRVAEPHHDGTPHWHLVLFIKPGDVERACAIFRRYALTEDGDEPGASENRFSVTLIEKEKGSATGYMAKYISKNIDGYALDDEKDSETGEPLKAVAHRVSAWASRWAIRQFQQIGGAPVTVWRELRRLGERELVLHPEIEPAHEAANASEWSAYVMAQGGPLVTRKLLRVRLSYEIAENGNRYGDDVAKVSGVYSPLAGDNSQILTRITRYKIVPKQMCGDAGFSDDSTAPWSSVNNCTHKQVWDEQINEQACVDNGIDYSMLTRSERKALARRLVQQARMAERRRSEQHLQSRPAFRR